MQVRILSCSPYNVAFHYENVQVDAQDGAVLGYVSNKRAQWYVSRGLARRLGKKHVSLTFEPKGRSEAGLHQIVGPRENKCVVCGTVNDLTRHHMIPYCIRRHMPLEWKSHNSYDVVALCERHHRQYNRSANKILKGMQERSRSHDAHDDIIGVVRAIRIARSVVVHGDKMPEDRLEANLEIVRGVFGPVERDSSLFHLIADLDVSGCSDFKLSVWIDAAQDVDGMIRLWCPHFYTTMKPKYMPGGFGVRAYTSILLKVADERMNGSET